MSYRPMQDLLDRLIALRENSLGVLAVVLGGLVCGAVGWAAVSAIWRAFNS